VARRHESLRTTFEERDGNTVQRVAAEWPGTLKRIDLEEPDADRRQARVGELLAQESLIPFDLTRGPVFRATLIKEADDRHVLTVTTHHIVSDGWSSTIFVRDLAHCYDA